MEGAVLEEAVYPAHIFNGSGEGIAIVCEIGKEFGLCLVLRCANQLCVLWEPNHHAIVPATDLTVYRALKNANHQHVPV